MPTLRLRYRTWFKGLPPRPIRLEVPGWAGAPDGMEDGSTPQPWHCQPFVDASTYGLEFVYPFETECRVRTENGMAVFDRDFRGESPWQAPRAPVARPPSTAFAAGFYGFTSSLELVPPPGHVVRLEPHPRVYTDGSGDVPFAIAEHVHRSWPRVFFVVFRNPAPGGVQVFRKGEPYAQVLVVPERAGYDVSPLTEAQRQRHEWLEEAVATTEDLPTRSWTTEGGRRFDNRYKVLRCLYAEGGWRAVLRAVGIRAGGRA